MNAPIHHSSREGGIWTDARVTQLTELWLDGVSAGLIAKQMDLSKNVVIGKVHRLRLPGRPSPIRSGEQTVPKKEKIAATTKPAKPKIPTTRTFSYHRGHHKRKTGLPTSTPKFARVVTGVLFRGCQWITGEPSADDSCKCGAAVGETRVYCPEHEIKARRTRLAWGEATA